MRNWICFHNKKVQQEEENVYPNNNQRNFEKIAIEASQCDAIPSYEDNDISGEVYIYISSFDFPSRQTIDFVIQSGLAWKGENILHTSVRLSYPHDNLKSSLEPFSYHHLLYETDSYGNCPIDFALTKHRKKLFAFLHEEMEIYKSRIQMEISLHIYVSTVAQLICSFITSSHELTYV